MDDEHPRQFTITQWHPKVLCCLLVSQLSIASLDFEGSRWITESDVKIKTPKFRAAILQEWVEFKPNVVEGK